MLFGSTEFHYQPFRRRIEAFMHDLSDEATGLPPLHEVDSVDSILALQWVVGVEGIVSYAGDDVAVKYLSLRGLILDAEGSPQYGQVHVAMPHDAVRPMLEQWLSALDEPPTSDA